MSKFAVGIRTINWLSLVALSGVALMGCETDYSVSVNRPATSNVAPASVPVDGPSATPTPSISVTPSPTDSPSPSPSPSPSASPSPSPSTVICGGFGDGSGTPSGSSGNGIVGKLYYLDSGNPSGYTTTDDYIQYGYSPEGLSFIFSQLNIPTYNFSQGFQAPDGSYLQDNQGNKLVSYFGFHFTTTIALSSGDTDGLYQFATLSDDGGSVRIVNSDGTLSSLIDAEGDHATELDCASRAIAMDSTTRMPVEINWHQGPPTQIAIMMLWRKVDGSNASLQDNYCGYQSTTDYFDSSTVPSTAKQGWLDLQAHGWKVLAPSNYLMPGNTTNTCSTK